MNRLASIVIITCNAVEVTRACLESLLSRPAGVAFELILVDNGSNDGTIELLQDIAARHPHTRVLLNPENRGFPAACNQGARAASGESIVFLNNDTLLTTGWLARLLSYLDNPQVGMVGAVTNRSGNKSQVEVDYTDEAGIEAFASRRAREYAGQAFEIEMLPFLCVAMRRSVHERIGPLDERFGIGMFEDDDYALRMQQEGLRVLCAEDVFVHHTGSASFSRMGVLLYWRLFRENLQTFEAKWGRAWTPQPLRRDAIRRQLRRVIDGSLHLAQMLEEQTETTAQQAARAAASEARLVDLECERDAALAHAQDLEQEKAALQRQVEQLGARSAELTGEIDELRALQLRLVAEKADLAGRVSSLQVERRTLETSKAATQAQVNLLRYELDNIYTSNGWALLQTVLRVRRFFIPEGSRRERLLRLLLRVVRRRPAPTQASAGTQPAGGPALISQRRELGGALAPAGLHAAGPGERLPLVSVILPVYNHADMLAAAARSVLDCTYRRLELIILDDGSTDAIEPVLDHLRSDPRVRIFRQPNQKLPRALTHAHLEARGEYLTWTSSDNLMAPEAITVLVAELMAHPEAMLAYADLAVIDEYGQPLRDGTYRPQNVDPARRDVLRLYQDARALGLEADNYINACFLYRREAGLALEGHYADDLRGLEDYDFWLRLQKVGPLRHVRNREPLYFYRVHPRSMSTELLSRERQAHLERLERFIAREAERGAYTRRRWSLRWTGDLGKSDRQALVRIAADVPFDLTNDDRAPSFAERRLCVGARPPRNDENPYIECRPHEWVLHWRSPWDGGDHALALWRGMEMSALALKAREHRKNPWEFPQCGGRAIVGCHLALGASAIEVEAARRIIRNSPSVFFVVVDVSGGENLALGERLVAGLENAVYLGPRPLGTPYALYACFDFLWLPPAPRTRDEAEVREALTLACAIGRRLLVPHDSPRVTAPGQLAYSPPDQSLDFVSSLAGARLDSDIANRYLEAWRPAARVAQLLRYADAIGQEVAVPRPDFGQAGEPVTPAMRWPSGRGVKRAETRCVLLVDSLDRGGLEGVVGNLARNLPPAGVATQIVCWKSGGATARALASQGVAVDIVEQDPRALRRTLSKARPHVVHSHFASRPALEIARELGLPVLEHIHNTYVWLDEAGWEEERARSRLFTRAVAVSRLVRRYYSHRNPEWEADWIDILPNGIDLLGRDSIDYTAARERLGIGREEVLLLNLASYDGIKNQLGLVAAFDEVAARFPKARLWCAGAAANREYRARVVALRDGLRAREQVVLDEHRSDVPLLLSAADVFVMDSFAEGWSLAATEALLAGVPLVFSECGGASELAGEAGERGLIVPNPACDPINLDRETLFRVILEPRQRNRAALVEALSQMVAARDDWQMRRTQLRDHAASHFGLAQQIQQVVPRLQQTALGDKHLSDMMIRGMDEGTPPSRPSLSPDNLAELDFWTRELALTGDHPEDIAARVVPERMGAVFPPAMNRVLEWLAARGINRPRVLDVGSGPLSLLVHGWQTGRLDLVACDPLADHYRPLLARNGLSASYPQLACPGEALVTHFGRASFDVAWIHNALDHSADPQKVLREMADVLRPGGYLLFQGWSREGSAQRWQGLHRHDLFLDSERQLMTESHHEGRAIAARRIASDVPLEVVEMTDTPAHGRTWLSIIWRKLPAD